MTDRDSTRQPRTLQYGQGQNRTDRDRTGQKKTKQDRQGQYRTDRGSTGQTTVLDGQGHNMTT